LFTLVGIAGEDDLDAPDLCNAPSPIAASDERSPKPGSGQFEKPLRRPGDGRQRHSISGERPSTLEPDRSAALRRILLAGLGNITSADGAAMWAQGALPDKNHLSASDAKLVEDAFEQKVAEFASSESAEALAADAAEGTAGHATGADKALPNENSSLTKPDCIDKSILAIATPRRYRNREHLRYVAQQACLICGRKQSDPHHLRYLQPRALGRKVSDEFAVPLCRSHHRAVHRASNEQTWWKATGIDPVEVARQLWCQTRLNGPLAPSNIRAVISDPGHVSKSSPDQADLGRPDDGAP
jgi:hypothetical protein